MCALRKIAIVGSRIDTRTGCGPTVDNTKRFFTAFLKIEISWLAAGLKWKWERVVELDVGECCRCDVVGIPYYVTRVVSQSNLRVSSQFKGVSLGNSEFGAKPAQWGAEAPWWGLVSASATNHPIVLPGLLTLRWYLTEDSYPVSKMGEDQEI